MAEIAFPNIVGQYQQGQQIGREFRAQDEAREKQSLLSQLASQAYGTRGDERAGLVRQAIATDPASGFELEDTLQGLEDAGQKRLIQSARFLMAAPEEQREGIYQQLKPQLSQMGLQLPENYDQTVADTATALASAYGPGQSADSVVVGNTLVNRATGQPIFTAPDAPRYIEGDNGVFVATPEGLRRLDVTAQGAPRAAQQTRMSGVSVQGPGGEMGVYAIGDDGRPVFIADSVDPNVRAQLLGGQEGQFATQDAVPKFQVDTGGGQGGGFVPRGAGRQAAADRRADEHLRLAQEDAARARRAEERQVAANAITGKPPTEGERKAATLLSRLEFSLGQLTDATGQDASAASPNVGAEIARRLPFVGGDTAANFLTPAQRQQVESAQLDILDAALTLGTGAAYTREQLEGYRRSYFPQLGDSQENIDAKAARLQNVVNAARIAAGRAAPEVGAQRGGAGQQGGQGGNRPDAPAVGTVRNGYRYNGGDPASQSSWEEVR